MNCTRLSRAACHPVGRVGRPRRGRRRRPRRSTWRPGRGRRGSPAVEVVPGRADRALRRRRRPGGAGGAAARLDARRRARRAATLVEVPVVVRRRRPGVRRRAWGTDVDGVVARHSEVEYVAAFCGFAPGFAYLSGLPPELAVPRLESPRPRVPAGSVGLAGGWCGVYPTASPGGWRLLGRTDAALWDPDRDRAGAARRRAPGWCSSRDDLPPRARHRAAGDRPGPRPRPGWPTSASPAPAPWTRRPPRSPTGSSATTRTPPCSRSCSAASRCRADAGLLGGGHRRRPRARDGAEWLAGRAATLRRSATPATGVRSLPRGRRRDRGRRRCSARGPPTRWPGSGPPRVEAGAVLPVGEPTRPPAGARHARDRRARARCGCASGRAPTGSPTTRSTGSARRRTSWPRTRTGSACASTGRRCRGGARRRAGQRGHGARRGAGAAERRSRSCSWPTTRRPAATRCSRSSTRTTCGSARSCGPGDEVRFTPLADGRGPRAERRVVLGIAAHRPGGGLRGLEPHRHHAAARAPHPALAHLGVHDVHAGRPACAGSGAAPRSRAAPPRPRSSRRTGPPAPSRRARRRRRPSRRTPPEVSRSASSPRASRAIVDAVSVGEASVVDRLRVVKSCIRTLIVTVRPDSPLLRSRFATSPACRVSRCSIRLRSVRSWS